MVHWCKWFCIVVSKTNGTGPAPVCTTIMDTNIIKNVLINGEQPHMVEKSVDIPDSVETSKRIVDYLEEVKPLLMYFNFGEMLKYVNYREEGNDEAAKEIILDKAGEINALFADVFAKIFKKD